MSTLDVREKFINYFKGLPRNHNEINPAPLVLENDPTTLFTSSGMQPLVPYLMGEKYKNSEGKLVRRLVDSQPCVRTVDIEEVGDNRHLTFFEMLGNWSLGDYFKKDQLSWFFEFLTKELDLSQERIWVSVFEGNNDVPKDEESAEIWRKLGIPEKRIKFYSVEKNWWSRSGTPEQMPVGEIGGPDSEVFYDFGENFGFHEHSQWKSESCHPNCDCGRFLEIGNSVFMQYNKIGGGKLEELPQKNVDFGGGLERIVAAVNENPDIYYTNLFWPIIKCIQDVSGVKYVGNQSDYRLISDHLKAAVFLAVNGVKPSNKQQGYILRRLIRRAVVRMKNIKVSGVNSFDKQSKLDESVYKSIVQAIFKIYEDKYLNIKDVDMASEVIETEAKRFYEAYDRGVRLIGKVQPFDLYQSYGLPLETIEDLYNERKLKFYKKELIKEIEKHKNLSRSTSAGVFKGGLADSGPEVVKLHTATHILLTSLRKIFGEHVVQRGQNITKDRSRFDFPSDEKLTDKQLKEVEDAINDTISRNLPVNFVVMPKSEALKTGAIHAFNEKYTDTVKVYYIGENSESAVSREFCGGPHVTNTSEIGRVKINKQEKIGSGLMRVYLVLQK